MNNKMKKLLNEQATQIDKILQVFDYAESEIEDEATLEEIYSSLNSTRDIILELVEDS
jgi:hypothetical protein